MAILDCTFYSYELGMDMPFQVIFPEPRSGNPELKDKRYKILYCLHGQSRDHTTFSRYGILEHLLGSSDVIAVIPNAHRSFFMDEKQGYRYFTYLTEELPTILYNTFPVSREAKDHYLCGFSMGGYGALRTILKYPDRYAAASVISVAVEPFKCMDMMVEQFTGTSPDLQSNMNRVFGTREEFEHSDANPYVLIAEAEKRGIFPRIHHACGKQDFLYDMNQQLRTALEHSFPADKFTYFECSGGHEWFFWNEALKEMAHTFDFI